MAGTIAVCAKATEGVGWFSQFYTNQKAEAARQGAFFFAYHFLHEGNGAAQADYCYSKVGKTPLMLDWEYTAGSNPGVADAVAFIDRFRALGGIINLVYLPKWYWEGHIGSPSLAPIASRGLQNVTSEYTAYSDNGPGWVSFGGLPVAVWQFTSTLLFNGQRVDFNAFKGTLDQLKVLVQGGNVDPTTLILRLGDTGDAVKEMQRRINVWNAAHPPLTIDGDFGPATLAGLREFQKEHGLVVDGVCGPLTWAALEKNPAPTSVQVPDVTGKNAGEAHDALVAAGLVPTAYPGQRASDKVTGLNPSTGTTVETGTRVEILSTPYHGEYVTGGLFDLQGLADKLGVGVDGPATLLRMTAVHYGTFGDELGALVRDILTGVKPWNTPVPQGVKLWCD